MVRRLYLLSDGGCLGTRFWELSEAAEAMRALALARERDPRCHLAVI